MARLKVKQISDFTSAVNNLIGSGQVAVDDSIDSLESQLSEGLDSLGVIDSAISNALSTEIATTDTQVGSLEVIDSAISTALSTEIATTGTEIDALQDSVDSLESQLNGFAKEAYIHLTATGLVTGSGATTQVLDSDGASAGDNVTEAAGEYIFDLAIPMEANNAKDAKANLFVEVNGLGVDVSALRYNSQTSWSLLESGLGYTLEASDKVEFKYIKD